MHAYETRERERREKLLSSHFLRPKSLFDPDAADQLQLRRRPPSLVQFPLHRAITLSPIKTVSFARDRQTDRQRGRAGDKKREVALCRKKCPLLLPFIFHVPRPLNSLYKWGVRSTNSKLVLQKVKGQTVQGQTAQDF